MLDVSRNQVGVVISLFHDDLIKHQVVFVGKNLAGGRRCADRDAVLLNDGEGLFDPLLAKPELFSAEDLVILRENVVIVKRDDLIGGDCVHDLNRRAVGMLGEQ